MKKAISYLVFAGTSEGRQLAEFFQKNQIPALFCVATAYGEELLEQTEEIRVHTGRMDEIQMQACILELMKTGLQAVIDATHPHAVDVTENLKRACEAAGARYIRLLRKPLDLSAYDHIVTVKSCQEAADWLEAQQGNIFLTTGLKELPEIAAQITDKKRLYARVLPQEEAFAVAEGIGLQKKQLICMQGPFSEELNIAMLHQFDCKYLVTKETGKAGGFEEKLHAAKAAGATLVLVGRPPEQKGYSYDEVLEMMRIRFHLAAASVLEVQPTQAKRKVTLVGIGIGTPEGMTVEAAQVIEKADLLVGADRMLAAAADKHKPTFSAYEPRKIGDYLELHPEYQRVVVLLSGDIGFYSGAKRLYEELEQRDFEVDALCGISSVVYFCGKLRTAWEDVCLLSTHGRSANLVGAVKSHHKTFTLLGKGESVHVLCQELMEYGLAHVTVHIGIQLGYEDEKILSGTPEELLKQSIDGLCVALIENETPFSGIRACVDDEEFSRGKAPMTKSEIRSLSVAKLQLPKDAVVYDVGAGTGSVTIELALAAVDGCIYAIERNQEACDLIEENKRKFGTPNIQVVHGLAPEAMEDLPAPTHVFIGGSAGNLKEIITCLLGKNPLIRLVINTVTLETMAEVSECLKALNLIEEETICVNVSRAKKLGAYHLMMGQNPIYIVTCRGGGEV